MWLESQLSDLIALHYILYPCLKDIAYQQKITFNDEFQYMSRPAKRLFEIQNVSKEYSICKKFTYFTAYLCELYSSVQFYSVKLIVH